MHHVEFISDFAKSLSSGSNSVQTRLRRKSVAAIAMVGVLFGTTPARSSDITWDGNYRVEAIKLTNAELDSKNSDKAYFLHHLTLMPKIVPVDGITIHARLDILNDSAWGVDPMTGRIHSLAGDVLGAGPNPGLPDSAVPEGSNAWARTQRAGNLGITNLYATWVQEFGQLVVGRAPVQFGLGTALNAGNGLFDHYMDTKDLVAYKMVFGNLFLMPAMGKIHEGVLGEEDDVNDYSAHMQYDNPETELSLGVLYQVRVGTYAGNDSAVVGASGSAIPGQIGGLGSVRHDGFKQTLIGLYSSQRNGDLRINAEADLLSGDTGIRTSSGNGVSLNSFGFAGEVLWLPQESKFTGAIKIGMATGDDPDTTETYEGYTFSRNYDVAMLMFNHPLGQADFMRTGLVRDTTAKASNQIDTEAISNVIYVAPSFQVKSRDNLSWGGALIYGMLNKDPMVGDTHTANNLGIELDLNVTYKPMERLTWITEAGALLPGEAWKGGSTGLDTKFAYGVLTKAAISF